MADENWQSFNGIHPVYFMKWLSQQRPIYAGQIAAGPSPIVPVSPPTERIISPEARMRMIQASSRIYPDQPKAVHIDPTPIYDTGVQPTNPEIIERLNAYGEVGSRPWYPEPYIPYVGWPNRYLQTGEQV